MGIKEAGSKNIRTCRLVMNCILEMLLKKKIENMGEHVRGF